MPQGICLSRGYLRPTVDRTILWHGVIIDATSCHGGEIPLSVIEPYGGKMRLCQFVLLKLAMTAIGGKEQYFDGYPLLTAEAAEYLAGQELHWRGH